LSNDTHNGERCGEDLDAECRQARSDYNAAQYQRRKELAEEAPAVVAVLPADLPVPPGPWEGWEIPTNQIGLQPAANVWSRVDGAPEGSIPVERVTTWTWGARMGLDPVGQVVQDWHDNAPASGTGSTRSHHTSGPKRSTASVTERSRSPEEDGHGGPPAHDPTLTPSSTLTGPAIPTPTRPTPQRGRGHLESQRGPCTKCGSAATLCCTTANGSTCSPDGSSERRPAHQSPMDGNSHPRATRLGAGLLTRAPWRVRSADQAISEWSWARSSPLTVIVVSPRPENRWEAYRGYGGMAESVGQFGGRDEAIEAARTLIDQDRNEVEWTGTLPPVQIIEAASPGYAAIENARTTEPVG
jgi:hypothetical protein